jgi:hypothetical protein
MDNFMSRNGDAIRSNESFLVHGKALQAALVMMLYERYPAQRDGISIGFHSINRRISSRRLPGTLCTVLRQNSGYVILRKCT